MHFRKTGIVLLLLLLMVVVVNSDQHISLNKTLCCLIYFKVLRECKLHPAANTKLAMHFDMKFDKSDSAHRSSLYRVHGNIMSLSKLINKPIDVQSNTNNFDRVKEKKNHCVCKQISSSRKSKRVLQPMHWV